MNPYSSLDLSVVQSPEHRNLSLEAAVKSFVLLKNQRGTLPLRARDLPGKRLAVRSGAASSVPPPPSPFFGEPRTAWPGAVGAHPHPLWPPQVVGPFADNPRVLFGDYAPVPEPRHIYTPR